MRRAGDSSMYWCSSAASARAECEVVAERLLDDDARVLRQARLGEALDDRAEQERRDLEVEDRASRALDRLADALVGRRVGEVAGDVREPGGEAARRPPRRAARRCRRSTSRARSTSWSTVQSSTATPTIGQSSSPRCSSRYSDRNVITFARSPVIPKTTRTSAGRDSLPTFATLVCGACVALMPLPLSVLSSPTRPVWSRRALPHVPRLTHPHRR